MGEQCLSPLLVLICDAVANIVEFTILVITSNVAVTVSGILLDPVDVFVADLRCVDDDVCVVLIDFTAVFGSNTVYDEVHDDDAQKGTYEVHKELIQSIRTLKTYTAGPVLQQNCIIVCNDRKHSNNDDI